MSHEGRGWSLRACRPMQSISQVGIVCCNEKQACMHHLIPLIKQALHAQPEGTVVQRIMFASLTAIGLAISMIVTESEAVFHHEKRHDDEQPNLWVCRDGCLLFIQIADSGRCYAAQYLLYGPAKKKVPWYQGIILGNKVCNTCQGCLTSFPKIFCSWTEADTGHACRAHHAHRESHKRRLCMRTERSRSQAARQRVWGRGSHL